MVFTNDGVQSKRSSGGRDSWKRWSDLQLKQDSKLFPQLKVSSCFCYISYDVMATAASIHVFLYKETSFLNNLVLDLLKFKKLL